MRASLSLMKQGSLALLFSGFAVQVFGFAVQVFGSPVRVSGLAVSLLATTQTPGVPRSCGSGG